MCDLAAVVPFQGPVTLGIRVAVMNLELGEGRLEAGADRLSLEGSVAFNFFGNQGDGDISLRAAQNGNGEWDVALRLEGTMGGEPMAVRVEGTGPCITERKPEDPTLSFGLAAGAIKVYRKRDRVFLDLSAVVPKLPGPLFLKPIEVRTD
jgi:hypothetical protein